MKKLSKKPDLSRLSADTRCIVQRMLQEMLKLGRADGIQKGEEQLLSLSDRPPGALAEQIHKSALELYKEGFDRGWEKALEQEEE